MSCLFSLFNFLLIFFLSWILFIKNTIMFYKGSLTWTKFILYIVDLSLNSLFWFMIFFFSVVNQPCPYATFPFIYYGFKYYLHNIKNSAVLYNRNRVLYSEIYETTLFLQASPIMITESFHNFKQISYIIGYTLLNAEKNPYFMLFSKAKNKYYNMFNLYKKVYIFKSFDLYTLIIGVIWTPLSRRSPYCKLSKKH